jgi:hypothetical protein
MSVYEVFLHAITNRLQVVCFYNGLYREVCPHALGLKRGKRHVLVFQFAGESSRGLPPEGEWRCMNVGEIMGAELRQGDWHTGDSHLRPQTCVDDIDVEVDY